jgi:hypothetical protein
VAYRSAARQRRRNKQIYDKQARLHDNNWKEQQMSYLFYTTVGKNVSTEAVDTVGICRQATTGEGTSDGEILVRATVNCKLCKLAIAL